LIRGNLENIPEIDREEQESLFRIAQNLDRYKKPEEFNSDPVSKAHSNEELPGSDFNNRANLPELLERNGWKRSGSSDNYWTRPGKKKGVSATWNSSELTKNRFRVFSTSTNFECKSYSPFAVLAFLEYEGDFGIAASELYKQGYGKRFEKHSRNFSNGSSIPLSQQEEEMAQEGKQELRFEELKLRSIGELRGFGPEGDPNEIIKNRYWCKKGGLLIVGPSGLGKSTLILQLVFCFAAGKPFFGLEPRVGQKFSCWIFQAENDDGDLVEQRDGILRGMGWGEETAQDALGRVKIMTVDSLSGAELVAMIQEKLIEAQAHGEMPDYIVLDPAHAYIDGDSSKGVDVTTFLRKQLQPLIRRFNIGSLTIHHTNKPKEENGKKWPPNDGTYLASGSAEWENWHRAGIGLEAVPGKQVFKLRLGKRRVRAGWRRGDGTVFFEKTLAHSKTPGNICWEEIPEESYVPIAKETARVKQQRKLEGFLSIFPTEFDRDNPVESYLWTSKINSRRKLMVEQEHRFSNDDVCELKDISVKKSKILRWKEGQKECVMLTSIYEESQLAQEYFSGNEAVYEAYQIALKYRQKKERKEDEIKTLL